MNGHLCKSVRSRKPQSHQRGIIAHTIQTTGKIKHAIMGRESDADGQENVISSNRYT